MKKVKTIFGSVLFVALLTVSCGNKKEGNNEANEDSKIEEVEKSCISSNDAKSKVKDYLNSKLYSGALEASWNSSEWTTEKQDNGYNVNTTLYSGGEAINQPFFVDCQGNVY
jgi:hypothetical protein